jgi:uncharacterized protein involved in type VI secretion and phage assembly
MQIDQMILEYLRTHYFGKYRGTVSDNQDPTNRGRIKVKVPAVLGDLEVWAMPCVPYAGDQVGFYSLPPQGSGVWVEFEGGDPSCPIWAGCFWADNELPDTTGPDVKVWKTDAHTVKLDDAQDELLIQNGSASKTTYATDVTVESGRSTLTVGSGGVVSEAGANKLEVTPASVSVSGSTLQLM